MFGQNVTCVTYGDRSAILNFTYYPEIPKTGVSFNIQSIPTYMYETVIVLWEDLRRISATITMAAMMYINLLHAAPRYACE